MYSNAGVPYNSETLSHISGIDDMIINSSPTRHFNVHTEE